MANGLTEKQSSVLEFIRSFSGANGFPPTLREIAANYKIAASSVLGHLRALESKGYIRRHAAKPRCLEILKR